MERKVNSLRDILRILILTLLFLGFAAGTVSGNINVTLSPSSGTNGSTVNMNFTVNDTTNATSWFNFTFPSSFNIAGALINYLINGVSSGWANSTGSDYINVTGGGTIAYAGNISYINFSKITVTGGATSTFVTVRTNNSGAIVVDYTVTTIPLRPEMDTSYWGTVKILGNLAPNASVTIYGADAVEIVNKTSNSSNSLYQIQVPWDDLATSGDEGVVLGETLTFKVNGTTATTRVVDTKGSSINLNLDTTPPCTSCNGNGGSGGSGGSGGGGGGGGASGENYNNIDVIEKYDMQISKDALTSYRFTHAKNPIMFVNITGNTTLGMISASIEVLKATSTLVKVLPEGLVYKNANIWVGTSGFATPKNIKEALIKFKIDNAWLSANGVSAGDIVLMKWDGKAWISLKTTVLSKDDTNSYFEGWTNSFSPFAIVAKTAGGAQPTATTATPAGTPQITATVKPEPIDEKSGISPWIIGLIILVIIGAGAYYFLVVKKNE